MYFPFSAASLKDCTVACRVLNFYDAMFDDAKRK